MSEALNIELHPKQTEAFLTKATELLYGGAAGGGKSHFMRVAATLWCSEIPGLQVYLFRRISGDLYGNHMEGAGGFFQLLGEWIAEGLVNYNGSKNCLTFWNGSKIWLCHCQHEKDKIKYQGREIHVLLIDELTHFTESIYKFLRSRCRLGDLQKAIPDKYKGMFPRIICGSNPGGVGHAWVKRSFVDMAAYKTIVKQSKKEGGMLRQYIPAVLTDNPSLEEDYADKLSGLGSPDLVKAMLNGDWNIVAGGAVDDLWSYSTHVIDRFIIPKNWYIDRSFDWGTATPFSVCWWAEANGEEVELLDGRVICPPEGTLFQIAEWYGSKELGSNKGLSLSIKELASGIDAIESNLKNLGWITRKPEPGPADNQIDNKLQVEVDTFQKQMADHGLYWTRSNKDAGTRVIGLQLLRDRLQASNEQSEAGIYFMKNCRASIATVPLLQRDQKNPEQVAKKGEDHAYDAIKYRVLNGSNRYAKSLDLKYST